MDSVEFYSMESERLKSLAEVERTLAVRQNIGVAFVTFDDASVASRSRASHVNRDIRASPSAVCSSYLVTYLFFSDSVQLASFSRD